MTTFILNVNISIRFSSKYQRWHIMALNRASSHFWMNALCLFVVVVCLKMYLSCFSGTCSLNHKVSVMLHSHQMRCKPTLTHKVDAAAADENIPIWRRSRLRWLKLLEWRNAKFPLIAKLKPIDDSKVHQLLRMKLPALRALIQTSRSSVRATAQPQAALETSQCGSWRRQLCVCALGPTHMASPQQGQLSICSHFS